MVGHRALLLRRHWQSQPPRRVLAFLSRTNLISCLAMWTLPDHLVVSDASPGPLALVENGVTGLVVPVNDDDALAAALERLVIDPDLCARLGTAASMRMRDHAWDVLDSQWRTVLAQS